MSCYHIKIGNSHGIITLANIFQYKNFTFEWHSYCGPMRVKKKNLEICKRPLGRKFLQVACEWNKLPKRQREKYRIYG